MNGEWLCVDNYGAVVAEKTQRPIKLKEKYLNADYETENIPKITAEDIKRAKEVCSSIKTFSFNEKRRTLLNGKIIF